MSEAVVLDDRLLIEELLVGIPRHPPSDPPIQLHTTTYWYYRASRAAVLGAGGHLSGPFERVGATEQAAAVLSLLELRADISLPDPRPTVPQMVRIAARNPQLNLLNLEAVAVGMLLEATLWLSPESAAGILPVVLEREGLPWRTISVAGDGTPR